MTERDIQLRFPDGEKGVKKALNNMYRDLAKRLDLILPPNREKTIAIEKLEESLLWAWRATEMEDGNNLY